eukprot:gene2904-3356_t
MAENIGEDYVQGEMLDFFFEFMEEDECDDMLDAHLNLAVDELTDDKLQSCAVNGCGKQYKTKSGLERHKKAKHSTPVNQVQAKKPFYLAVLKTFVRDAVSIISNDECYPNNIRNAEKFYSSYYASVVVNAEFYFPPLTRPACTILATTLGDKVLAYYSKPDQKQVSNVKPITCKEMDGLQYLAGYVLHAMSRKMHKQKSKEDVSEILLILNSARTQQPPSHKLIKSLTRGGLWEVKPEWVQIFKQVEEEFRKETDICKTNIILAHIVTNLLGNVAIVSMYNTVLENVTHYLSKEKCFCLLEKMIALYLRVRSLSYAKDKTYELNKKGQKDWVVDLRTHQNEILPKVKITQKH